MTCPLGGVVVAKSGDGFEPLFPVNKLMAKHKRSTENYYNSVPKTNKL